MEQKTKILIGAGVLALIVISIILVDGGYFKKIESKGCNYTEHIKTVELVQYTDSKTITFESEAVIITFGLEDFKSHLMQQKGAYNLLEEEAIINFIEEQAKEKDKINISNLVKELQPTNEHIKGTIEAHIANFLERGKFTLFDKSNNKYITKIDIQTYTSVCSPLSAVGGKMYRIPEENNKVFFEIVDWVS